MTHINPFSPACDFDSIEFRKAPLGILGGRMFYESTAAAEEDSITTTTTSALQSSSATQGKYQRCGGVVYPEVCLIDASLHVRANLPRHDVDDSNNLGDEGGEGSMAMFTTPFSEKKMLLNSAVVDPSPSFTNAHTKSQFGGTNHEENSIGLDRQRIFDVRNNNSGGLSQLSKNNVSTASSTSAMSRSLRHQDKSGMRHFASNCLSPTAWRDSLSRTEVALKIREALSASNLAAIPMVCPTLQILSSVIPHLQPWTLPITASKGSLFRLDDTATAASVSSPHRAFDLSNNSSACHTIRSMARVRGDVADVPTVQVIAFHPYLPVLAVCLQRSPRSSAIIRLFSVTEGAYIEGVELAHAFQRGVTTLQWKQPYSKGVLAVGASGGVLLWSIKCLEDFGKGKGSSSGRNIRSVGGSSSLNFSGTGQYNAGGIHAEQESITRSGAWRRSNVSSSQRVAETGATSPSDYSFNNNRSGANQGTNSWTQQNPHLSTSASQSQFDNSLPCWGGGDGAQCSSFIGRASMKSRKSDGGGGQREEEPSSSSATCVCYPCSGGDQGILISSIVFAKLPVQGNDGEYRACDTMLCGARQSPFVHIFDLHAIPEDSLMAKVAGFEGGGVSCLGISQMAASGASVGILASSSRGSTSQRRQGWKGPNRQHEEDSTHENEAEFDIQAVGAASKIVNRLFCVRGFESSKKIQVLNLGANNATTIFEMPQPVIRLERCDVTAEDAFAVQFDSCEVICIAVISPKQVSILANIVTGIHRGVGGRALDIRVCHSTLYVRVSSGHVLNISLLGSLRNSTREGKQLSAMITGGIALGAFSAASQWHLATPEDRGYLLSHLVGNSCVIAMDAFQNFQNGSLVAVVDSVSGVLKVVPTYYNRR